MIKTIATIDGMMCGMCEAHVNDAVRASFSVKKVSSSRKKGECVIISGNPIDREKLRDALGKAGYELLSLTEEPYHKKGFFGK